MRAMGVTVGRIQRVLGERVRALRLAAALTQRELAEGAGLDVKYFGRIERGGPNVTVETLVRIAGVLEVEPYELLMPSNAVARARVPDAGRIAALLERLDDDQRGRVLGVLEGFAVYGRGKRGGPGRR